MFNDILIWDDSQLKHPFATSGGFPATTPPAPTRFRPTIAIDTSAGCLQTHLDARIQNIYLDLDPTNTMGELMILVYPP